MGELTEAITTSSGAGRPRRRVGRRSRLLVATMALACGWACFLVGWTLSDVSNSPPVLRGVVPGEFEPCDALLMAWVQSATPSHQPIVATIAKAARRAKIVLLVQDARGRESATQALQRAGVAMEAVRFVEARCSYPWTRDYGPILLKSYRGGYECVDLRYDRDTEDELVPRRIAETLGMKHVQAPLALDGGNLLSNGAGLCLTTKATLTDNPGYSQAQVSELIRDYFGASQVVYLETLAGEKTGHVDVFCTFTAPDTVVVGEYAEEIDAVNKQVLDRNAKTLANLKTACGPLRVYRIPMPRRTTGSRWGTYTSVVYVNGLLLVPTYRHSDPQIEQRAFALYRRLLPTWTVAGVDCTSLLEKDGSLHCAARHLYGVDWDDPRCAVLAPPRYGRPF